MTKVTENNAITLMYYDDYAQANHFNLLLPRGSCYDAPLPEKTASSVSVDLDNIDNAYASAVKKASQRFLLSHYHLQVLKPLYPNNRVKLQLLILKEN